MSTPKKDGRTAPPSSAQKPRECPKTDLSNFGEAQKNIKSDKVRQRLLLASRNAKSAKRRKSIIESRRKSGGNTNLNQPKIW